jgi:hypothetical protein
MRLWRVISTLLGSPDANSGEWKSKTALPRARGFTPAGYVMSRKRDIGPYAIGNIEIVKVEVNVEGASHRTWTEETSAKIARAAALILPLPALLSDPTPSRVPDRRLRSRN